MSSISLPRSRVFIRFDDSSSDDDNYSDDDVTGIARQRLVEEDRRFAENLLRAWEEEDRLKREEEEPVIPPQIYVCGICFERFLVDVADRAAALDVTLFGTLLPCTHTYCDDCLREHTWVQLCNTDQNHIIRCPQPGCTQPITDDIAERVLRYDQFGEWTRRQVLASIENKVSHHLQHINVG
jgi:hypothetical protein